MALSYRDMRTNAQKIADEDVKERVLKGIEALKDEYGLNFADYIDPQRLDMQLDTMCMVGQLRSARGVAKNSEIRHFSYELAFDTEGFKTDYEDLDDAWLTALGVTPRW